MAVYFLSDAHLGSRAIENSRRHQQRLVQLLNEMGKDATAIYLLGDIFDYWCEYFWKDSSKQQYTPILDCLRSLTERRIEIHFFIGNHDLWTFGELSQRTGVVVHRTTWDTEIEGKRVYMCHGDGVLPSHYATLYPPHILKKLKRFIWLRKVFHSKFWQFWLRLLPPHWGNELGYEWARRSRLKELASPCPYKGEAQEELVLFAKEQEAIGQHHDFYIFGHRHIELDLQINKNSRIIILGDCFQQWTYARLDAQGLALYAYDEAEK